MKSHGNTGKKNASKTESNKATNNLYARCKKLDKEAWESRADEEGIHLSKWVIKQLNRNLKMPLENSIIATIRKTKTTEELHIVVNNFLTLIGRTDLHNMSYDECASELESSESTIMLEAVSQWDLLIENE